MTQLIVGRQSAILNSGVLTRPTNGQSTSEQIISLHSSTRKHGKLNSDFILISIIYATWSGAATGWRIIKWNMHALIIWKWSTPVDTSEPAKSIRKGGPSCDGVRTRDRNVLEQHGHERMNNNPAEAYSKSGYDLHSVLCRFVFLQKLHRLITSYE